MQLLFTEKDDELVVCSVNPHHMALKTKFQTAQSVLEDIESECKGMSKTRIRKCKIPKVLHSVVIGGSFKLHHYMSLKSIHDRIKPEKMYIHGYDFPFDSPYFNRSIQEFKIELVASRNVKYVFDNPVHLRHHKSDIIRLETLIRFGGMYFDLDVYALKDVDALLNGDHEYVMAPQNYFELNNGVMMSKRCARFPLLWYKEYKYFKDSEWSVLSIIKPTIMYYKLGAGINRIGLHVDRSLSSDWGSGILFKKEEDTPKEFWTDIRLVHAFWRDHGIEYNETSVQQLNSNLGRFARELFKANPENKN